MENDSRMAVQLQKIIYDTIPLGKASQLQVAELNANSIRIEAPVPGINSNIHNTAFAGSIYSACALTAWGLVHNRLLQEEIKAEVVIAQAEIKYEKPILKNIIAHAHLEETGFLEFKNKLLKKGKARLSVTVKASEDDTIQAQLDANIAVLLAS
ncbi:MAG: DUF4442 domain-containing protein [Gammaproteobacteria bacterium]|nr:DUF4442 domain-containing protein [Gammaproteobacteria bacterium]